MGLRTQAATLLNLEGCEKVEDTHSIHSSLEARLTRVL